MRKLKIFVSSPSDMAPERDKVKSVVSMLEPLANNLGITLALENFEAVAPGAGRPQQVISDALRPETWDVFIGILWHRFGQRAARKSSRAAAASGSGEEIKAALGAREQHGKPHVLIYRCTRPVPLDALDPEQFKRVQKLFGELEAVEGGRAFLYHTFDTAETFERLLLEHLRRVLLEYGEQGKGEPLDSRVVQAYAPSIPNNLPRRAPFFGREQEMGYVLRALSPEDRTWGVLIDGIGGIGKTALAIEAAYHCKERGLFDTFVFISAKQSLLTPGGIRQLSPPAHVLGDFLNETARVLGQPDIAKLTGDSKRRALLEALSPARALLIYDNLETLSKEEQEELADFLRTLPPGCKAITTSRRRGGEGAVWLRLEKLDWEAGRAIIESETTRDPRLANKLRLADETRLRELYDETKGSPLALMHTLGLLRVREELTLEGALALLRGSLDPDLQNFIFQEARRELTSNDQTALRALSFFVPSATFEAWVDVSGLSRSALETTVDRLSALSLVDVPPGEERFGLHPLTRNFVRDELLADADIAHETGMRFANYWVMYAARHGRGRANYKTFSLLEAEWPNLEGAAEWLWTTAGVSGGEIADANAAQLLNALADGLCGAGGPLFFAGRWDESLKLSARAYDAMRLMDTWESAGWRAYNVAWIHYYRDDIDGATRWADHCAEAWARAGSKREQAALMRLRGQVAMKRGDFAAAEQLFQESLKIRRELGSDDDMTPVLTALGQLEHRRKNYDATERYWLEALALDERTGNTEGVAVLFSSLVRLAVVRQRWEEAREWLDKALLVGSEVGRRDLIAHTQHSLALVYEAEGRPDLALPMAQEALIIREKLRLEEASRSTRKLIERLKKKIGE